MEFLKHFHMSICYETETKILTTLCQNTSTHIFNHIHGLRRRTRLVNAPISYKLLDGLFCKYILPTIEKYVTFSGAIVEEQVIFRSQHLDIIYHNLGMLYELIPNAPHTSNTYLT